MKPQHVHGKTNDVTSIHTGFIHTDVLKAGLRYDRRPPPPPGISPSTLFRIKVQDQVMFGMGHSPGAGGVCLARLIHRGWVLFPHLFLVAQVELSQLGRREPGEERETRNRKGGVRRRAEGRTRRGDDAERDVRPKGRSE